ncbi:MAG: hypothetical protein HYT47_03025 [Candidatus Vogelbacteria bacterium]|nr:hypothetical protein [Candidatus Vogelbacteria bacterium]
MFAALGVKLRRYSKHQGDWFENQIEVIFTRRLEFCVKPRTRLSAAAFSFPLFLLVCSL